MELKKIDDALTGSEYADVESFTNLKVRFTVDQRILVPQIFDSPFRRTLGRGVPFNPLGIVTVPIAMLPEGLQGLVQADGLLDEVDKLVANERIALAKLPENADVAMEVLQAKAEEIVGQFCIAAPGPEGIEVDGGVHNVRELVMDMRYRNKPEDHLFLNREIEVELSGVRSDNIKTAIDLKIRPNRSVGEKHHELARGYGMSDEGVRQLGCRSRRIRVPGVRTQTQDEIDFSIVVNTDYADLEKRVLSWYSDTDVRRQKFALTATKITLV